MHPSRLCEKDLLAQCTLRRDRRSGPGGQHRNKTETAVVIAHGPTGILAEASERRSQADNRQQAIFRLRLNLSVGYRAACDPREPASPLWIARRRDRRIVVSAKHQDYPALLAELLDFLQATDFELAAASEHFEVTASQLVRLLRSHPPALALVNARRATVGAGRLT